jgi:redox-sensitive bicupin YhaK (pirin superfamily)
MPERIRTVTKVIRAQPTSDGAGVRLSRSLGNSELDYLDPFLLLDEFKSESANDYLAGFPDHPHRGFETVTYMLAGAMQHRDHKGNEGNLTAGSIQWMTAGRGIVHSEMPKQERGLMWGFQLWVNLPAAVKMTAPRYQDIRPEEVPEIDLKDGTKIRVLAGEVLGVRGAVSGIVTDPLYLDVRVAAGGTHTINTTPGHTAFVYVFEGQATFGQSPASAGTAVPAQHLAVLSDGDTVTVAAPDGTTRFLLLAARPLHEPVARYGPFVMNTKEELVQAFEDFRRGTFLA